MKQHQKRAQRIVSDPSGQISLGDRIEIDGYHIPSFRTSVALQNGTHKNIMLRTWGGIGDQICAEPTLRWAAKNLTDCEVSLASPYPEMFSHIPFKETFKIPEVTPDYDKYFLFDTVVPATFLVWEFFAHATTNCVDFPSLCALRMQLPMKDKEIQLSSSRPNLHLENNSVIVHPGRHWDSKTFPKEWWDEVLSYLKIAGIRPVIIGSDHQDKIMKSEWTRGTVDVNTEGCIDLRNKTSLTETIWLLQRAKVLLTNDSSPMHMAASGDAWIGFVATCKFPEYICHWRHGEFAWREVNHSRGGLWEKMPKISNSKEEFFMDRCTPEEMHEWLPAPYAFAKWAIDKAQS